MFRSVRIALVAATIFLCPAIALAQVVNFESHLVHPLDITPDGTKLLAVNSPDARLEIFAIGPTGELTLVKEVPVGMDPVTVRARTNGEAWVVNHLSDNVTIVDLTSGSERVIQTLRVDDEPTDVVFAGTGNNRAFICISQRNRVDVYAASSPGNRLFSLNIDGEDPRALERSADGTEVYAAVFHSGNQTLIISGEGCTNSGCVPTMTRVRSTSSPYGGAIPPPPPGYNAGSQPFSSRPMTSLIVKWRNCGGGMHWCDDNDTSWDSMLMTPSSQVIQMPDRDVAVIDADAATPVVTAYTSGVGTLNFGIAVNPANGKLYVSNTDARNHIRFEKSNAGFTALNGHLVDTRVTVIQGTTVQGMLDLNPHIDYSAPVTSIDKTLSLGQPNGMAFNAAGDRLYAAAILSRKVAVLDTSSVPGSILARIDVGEGPVGVALAEAKQRLYVLNRHENTISVVNTGTNAEVLPRVGLYNPEPAIIKNGRKFLYDGQLTSGRGDIACATCHAFGDFDLMAWDLGDPTKVPPFDPRPSQTHTLMAVPPGFVECSTQPNFSGCGPFHPLKGPRTTQSLRGLADNAGCTGAGTPFPCCTGSGTGTCGDVRPLHWHGDRANFQAFNPAFVGLQSSLSQLSADDMNAYTSFIMTVSYPPNPNRNMDDTLTTNAQSGFNEYMSVTRDQSLFTCNQCHTLPTGTNGRFINANADQQHQAMKVAQLRNMYEKTGLSLHPDPGQTVPATTRSGFGFTHDGEVESLFTFLSIAVFNFPGATEINNMVEFLNEFPTGQATTVGQEVTFNGANNNNFVAVNVFNTLLKVLNQGKIELIVTGVYGGIPRSFRCTTVSQTEASCQSDRQGEPPVLASALKNGSASGSEMSFLAVPIGTSNRMGLDRDLDTFYNQDEIDAGSNPADPASTPETGINPIPTLSEWGTLALVGALILLSRARLRRGRIR
jgi:DNA-binding beta-propeller fold protein YncE